MICRLYCILADVKQWSSIECEVCLIEPFYCFTSCLDKNVLEIFREVSETSLIWGQFSNLILTLMGKYRIHEFSTIYVSIYLFLQISNKSRRGVKIDNINGVHLIKDIITQYMK